MILFFLTFGLIRAKTGAKHRCEDYEIFEGVDYGFDEKYSSIRRLRVWNSTIPVGLTRELIKNLIIFNIIYYIFLKTIYKILRPKLKKNADC